MISQFGAPALVFADWNAEQEELLGTGWPQKLNMVVRSLGIPTCVGGRCLGYCVVSRSLVAKLSGMSVIEDTPWKPHIGIRIDISLDPDHDEGLAQRQAVAISDALGPDMPWMHHKECARRIL